MKKTKKLAAVCLVTAVLLVACAPKPALFDISTAPDNERCNYMKDVCKEAHAFQNQFERMSRAEREEAKTVLNAFVQQCLDAQEMCRRTMDQ
jgi:triphosphoribosyl-dephospho-CoA synthetase